MNTNWVIYYNKAKSSDVGMLNCDKIVLIKVSTALTSIVKN